MKYHVYKIQMSALFFCLLTLAGVAESSKIVVVRCNEEVVAIRDIHIISPPDLRDEGGKPISSIIGGAASLYIAENELSVDELALKKISNQLSTVSKWAKKSLPSSGVSPVGLDEKFDDFMIFIDNSWKMVRLRNNRIRVFDAYLVVARGKVKIFTIKTDGDMILSETEDVVNVFQHLKKCKEVK